VDNPFGHLIRPYGQAMPGMSRTLLTRWRAIRRRLSWHRRSLAAALTAVAVVTGIAAARPAPPATIDVLVAASDLAGGSALTASDVEVAQVPTQFVPAGALRPPEAALDGRVLAAPMRPGEVVTDVRLVGPTVLDGYAPAGGSEIVGTPVRIGDSGAVRLVRPGDRVDVLAATGSDEFAAQSGAAAVAVVAPGVRVVTVPQEQDDLAVAEGALIVVATSERVAEQLAAAAVTSRLSLTLRPD
jgi:pilus assembly protein CpaB